MAVTRLERKGRKNKNVAKNRVATMKRLNSVPSIKNVDIEEIKKEFANKMQNSVTKEEEKKIENSKDEITATTASEPDENKNTPTDEKTSDLSVISDEKSETEET
ncbi:MAG: hypothetical protein AAGC64_09165 [Bacteroidota bacterium]